MKFSTAVTNRLFRKRKDGSAEELLTWRLPRRNIIFDPTFGGGAISAVQRNVFEALDDLARSLRMGFGGHDRGKRLSRSIQRRITTLNLLRITTRGDTL